MLPLLLFTPATSRKYILNAGFSVTVLNKPEKESWRELAEMYQEESEYILSHIY